MTAESSDCQTVLVPRAIVLLNVGLFYVFWLCFSLPNRFKMFIVIIISQYLS